MFHLTRHHLHHGHHGHHGRVGSDSAAEATLKRQKEEKQERTDRGITIGLSGATAAGLGYLHGRKGGMPNFKGIPLDGAMAALGIGAAMWKPKARWSNWMFGAGLGAWGYFAGTIGAKYGSQKRKDAGELLGRPLTDDEATKANVSPRAISAGGPMPSYAPVAQSASVKPAWM